MALIVNKLAAVFDLSQIQAGHLIYAKHYSWNEGKAGFVSSALEKQLTVQFFPGIGNITNHFFIPALEVAAGEWEIRWSDDLSEVLEYSINKDKEQQEMEGMNES